MKKCCVIAYVFGTSYHSYIPFYVYFINKAYPDYDIIIYTDEDIDKDYVLQIEELNCKSYKLCKINKHDIGLSTKALSILQINKGLRWLLHDTNLMQYESLYIGDIDILICNEDIGLYEQHVRHANFLNLPYSNCIRIYRKSKRQIFGGLIKYGIKSTIDSLLFPVNEWYRLTGLHFMFTKGCYDCLLEGKRSVIEELNLAAANTSKLWNVGNIGDESILYEVVKRSGLKLPHHPSNSEEMAEGVKVLDNNNPDTVLFRPHHGLHLALWRNDEVDKTIVLCNTYLKYWRDFEKKFNENRILKEMVYKGNSLASCQIRRMIAFYEKYENKHIY